MFHRLRHYLVNRLIDPLGAWIDNHADLIVWAVFHKITRTVVAWLIVFATAAVSLSQAWNNFNDDHRHDKNYGHTTIDFGGQWMMGAMLVHGHGHDLYNRRVQKELLEANYPRADQEPDAKQSDAEKLMSYFMGSDDRASQAVGALAAPFAATEPVGALGFFLASREYGTPRHFRDLPYAVGGPLYPPINAIIYAPIGMLQPPIGYRVNQVMNLFWAWIAALGVRSLSRRRIWTSVALTLIIFYPGFKGSIHLGQNAALTLAILTWGWALIVNERPIAAGIVWGLLAFKPVWAAAFFLVPFLTFRWTTCLAMLGTGTILAVLTLPLVGIQPWFDWLLVGTEASELYKTDYNWVFLSRDLLGIPRRWLMDFSQPSPLRDSVQPGVTSTTYMLVLLAGTIAAALRFGKRGRSIGVALVAGLLGIGWIDWLFLGWVQKLLATVPAATLVGWTIFAACLLFTVSLPLARPRQAQAATGAVAGFLLIGAWLSCFHFMYYDILLTALPLFVLMAEPRRFVEPILVALMPVDDPSLRGLPCYYGPLPPAGPAPLLPLLNPVYRNVWVLNRMVLNVVALLLVVEHLFPRIGLAGTISGMWLEPLKMTTMRDAEGQMLIYRKVYDLATMRVTTSPYDEGAPWDTFLIIFLWLWCAFLWLRTPRQAQPLPSNKPPQDEMEVAPLPVSEMS